MVHDGTKTCKEGLFTAYERSAIALFTKGYRSGDDKDFNLHVALDCMDVKDVSLFMEGYDAGMRDRRFIAKAMDNRGEEQDPFWPDIDDTP